VLTLVVSPAIYALVKEWELRRAARQLKSRPAAANLPATAQ
jgi:hypothetical protein